MFSTQRGYCCHFLCYLLRGKDISFTCLLTAVHFYSVTISLCSVSCIWCLWRLPVFFLLHSRLPHFPFILTCYCMKLGRADAEFLPLISRDFCAVLQREQPPPCCRCCYSALCCLCRWDIFLQPAFPELGTWVESLVFVLSQRCFCLRPIFCWIQPVIVYSCEIPPCHYRLPAWECMQMTGQEMSHL